MIQGPRRDDSPRAVSPRARGRGDEKLIREPADDREEPVRIVERPRPEHRKAGPRTQGGIDLVFGLVSSGNLEGGLGIAEDVFENSEIQGPTLPTAVNELDPMKPVPVPGVDRFRDSGGIGRAGEMSQLE